MDRPYRPTRDSYRDRPPRSNSRDRDNYRNHNDSRIRDDFRDRSHNEFRDRDDFRDRDLPPRRPSRFSDGPPPPENRRSPPRGVRRGFHSPPHDLPPREFPPRELPPRELPPPREMPPRGLHPPPPPGPPRPMGGGPHGGGFWPSSGPGPDVGGFVRDYQAPAPAHPPLPPPPQQRSPQLSGQKRGFSLPSRGGTSPEDSDGRSFVKVFVGSVPRTATEEEIRPLFEGQGKVMEVALIKDKRTGQQQGCCFIKYATSEEAERAIRSLHNQYTLPGGVGPIQVRYADGERERLGNGAVEYKLFVGAINKFATEKEVEEIFAPYGRIEDVYLMRDERKQSKGCGFVKFFNKDSAMAAINALNGIYTMRGCDQPLTVRFADPKRPRAGEPRAGLAFEGPGSGLSSSVGIRPASGPSFPRPVNVQGPPNVWQPMSPQNTGPSPNANIYGYGNQLPPRSGETAISSNPAGYPGPQGSLREGSGVGVIPASSASPQNFNQSFQYVPPSGQKISPLQKPVQSPQHPPPALQLHQGSYSQPQTSQASVRPFNQLPSGAQAPYSQPYSSQQLHIPGQMPPSIMVQQNATSATAQYLLNTSSSLTNSQRPAPAPQQPSPYQQSPSQLAQMLSQQTQTLQASFQSSQQAFSQLQQQLQMMQPANQNQMTQPANQNQNQNQMMQPANQNQNQMMQSANQNQNQTMQPANQNRNQNQMMQPLQHSFQAPKQQWAGPIPTTASSAPPLGLAADAPSTSSAPVGAVATDKSAPIKCNWTEHTSPDGHKYYYNSATGESRWEKPEDLTSFEQQQQKLVVQQPQMQAGVQATPNQQVTPSQPSHLQTQFRSTGQLQHPPFSSMYQANQGLGNQNAQAYSQFPAPANVDNDATRFHPGFPATENWAWKSNSGGT